MIWNAQWIWHQSLPQNDNVYIEFRKKFTLSELGKSALIKVSANQEYILWINGTKIGRGPSPSDNEWQYYDEYQVHDVLLENEENIITALVYNFGNDDIVTQQYQGPGGFLLQLNVGDYVLHTDTTWKCRQSNRWMQDVSRQHKWNGYKEVYLAANEDDWLALDYDDSAWYDSYVVADANSNDSPWKNLIRRDIPHLHHELVKPTSIIDISENYGEVTRESSLLEPIRMDASTPGAMPSVTFDFSQQKVGYIDIEIDAPEGGVIQLYYGETLDVRLYDTYILKHGINRVQPFGRRAFRYMKLVSQATPKPIKVKKIQVDMVHYKFEKEGKFKTSNELLNDIWDVSVYTTKVNSQDHIEDTPLRERALWVVDAVIMGRVIYQVFGDEALLRKCLLQIARIQNKDGSIPGTGPERNDMLLPDFCAHWLYGVWDYYQYTDDEEFLKELWETINQLMVWFQSLETDKGLITISKNEGIWCFIDWADYIDRRDQVSAISMFYYKALVIAGKIARTLKKNNQATLWLDRAEYLKKAIRTNLWDKKKSAYVDCLVGDDLSETITYQTNFVAIWTGIMNEKEAITFINNYFVNDRLPALKGPFFYHILLESLFDLNYHSLAIQVMNNYWGGMLDRGATTWWEAFDPKTPTCTIPGEFQGHTPTYLIDYIPVSLCHGWGSSPGYLLNQHVLGVDVSHLGIKKVHLHPHPFNLEHVEGEIPTKYGNIKVSMEKKGVNDYEYNYTIPNELNWTVSSEEHLKIYINGILSSSLKGGDS